MALQLVQDAMHGPNLRLVSPSAVEPVGLGDRLVEMGWRASDSHHQVVRLAAEFAGTVEWSVAGCSSAAQWMSERLDVALRTAREWIAVGRALRGLPVLDAALSDRTLSYAKVRMLVRTATPETESELVGLARSVSAGALGSAVAAWSRAHEPEDVRDERHRETRGLSWRVEPDGLTTGTLRLPADVAGGVMALIDAAVMRHRRSRGDRDAAHVSDPEFIEDDLGGTAPFPTLAQQRVDALVSVLCGGGADLVAEVVLHVRGDGATLDDGSPISQSAVIGALSGGFVRALIHDAAGTPVNASGRQRHPTTRQKRVVTERDRRCVDCGGHDLLEFDHVPEFAISGHTYVDELQLRCAACHRARHVRSGLRGSGPAPTQERGTP
jgi:hypothetical protein